MKDEHYTENQIFLSIAPLASDMTNKSQNSENHVNPLANEDEADEEDQADDSSEFFDSTEREQSIEIISTKKKKDHCLDAGGVDSLGRSMWSQWFILSRHIV